MRRVRMLPSDIWGVVASHLTVWERIYLSCVCKDMYHVTLPYGDLAQVQNKFYTNLQLCDLYKEWITLRSFKEKGWTVVWAPTYFSVFVRWYKKSNVDRLW